VKVLSLGLLSSLTIKYSTRDLTCGVTLIILREPRSFDVGRIMQMTEALHLASIHLYKLLLPVISHILDGSSRKLFYYFHLLYILKSF